MKFRKQNFKMKSDIILEIIFKEKLYNHNQLLQFGYDLNDESNELTSDEKKEISIQMRLNFIKETLYIEISQKLEDFDYDLLQAATTQLVTLTLNKNEKKL